MSDVILDCLPEHRHRFFIGHNVTGRCVHPDRGGNAFTFIVHDDRYTPDQRVFRDQGGLAG